MTDTADATNDQTGGSHWLRWLVLIALAVAAIAAGRKIALNAADKDFEQRLKELDAERD
jgi:hypothetical protein